MITRRAPVTVGILVAIVLVFLAEIASGMPLWHVTNQDTLVLARLGAITPGIFQSGGYWRLLVAMFLHIGLLHILLNGWALFQLGSVFEIMFGSTRFTVTYFVSGLIASVVSALRMTHDYPVVPHGLGYIPVSAGASGAIFGILGALILAIRRSPRWKHQSWTRSLTNQLIGWAVLNIIIGFSFPGIDNSAHLGGFAAGLALGLIPHNVPPPPPSGYTIETRPGQDRPTYHPQDDDGEIRTGRSGRAVHCLRRSRRRS